MFFHNSVQQVDAEAFDTASTARQAGGQGPVAAGYDVEKELAGRLVQVGTGRRKRVQSPHGDMN
jgi:hypothetical protein